MKFTILLLLLSITAYAQQREGTVSVDGTSYSVYSTPEGFGRTHIQFRSNSVLIAPQIPVTIPAPVVSEAAYWDADMLRYRDSLIVNGKTDALWFFHKNFNRWETQNDPEYRKFIINLCKENQLISQTYNEP